MFRSSSFCVACTLAIAISVPVFAQSTSQRDTSNQAPPRSDDRPPGESSSKDNPVDLSPPMGDAASHPNGGIADEVMELRPYDPHKAEKDVEVGDFYFKQKNYRAAESRYRGALQWKPNDAIATYKLADVLEKEGNKEEAANFYESYLKILPHGEYAAECKTALERLKNPGAQAKASESKDSKKKKK